MHTHPLPAADDGRPASTQTNRPHNQTRLMAPCSRLQHVSAMKYPMLLEQSLQQMCIATHLHSSCVMHQSVHPFYLPTVLAYLHINAYAHIGIHCTYWYTLHYRYATYTTQPYTHLPTVLAYLHINAYAHIGIHCTTGMQHTLHNPTRTCPRSWPAAVTPPPPTTHPPTNHPPRCQTTRHHHPQPPPHLRGTHGAVRRMHRPGLPYGSVAPGRARLHRCRALRPRSIRHACHIRKGSTYS
jgi:hypothetical protein